MNHDDEATEAPPAEDDKRFEPKWQKKSASIKTHEVPVVEQAETADLRRQLEQEQERTRTLQDRWQRAAADLANLKRRNEQDKGEVEKFATMLLVAELLPVLDNFERALATIPGNLQMLTWIQGTMLIERHLKAILEQRGLTPIEAVGNQFDPRLHEAVSERETAESAPGTVLQEYQKGYKMHDRVIRPTLVEIAKEPAPKDEEDPPSQNRQGNEGQAQPTEEGAVGEGSEEAQTENVGP